MTTNAATQQSALERRIRRFYYSLNRRDFGQCFQMIDPLVRDQPGSVTLFQYQNALLQFMEAFGPVAVLEVNVALHLNEPNQLYEGRDFAVGKTIGSDKGGERRTFLERWVRQGRTWYTRSTGFVTPEAPPVAPPGAEREAPVPRARILRSPG